MNPVFNTYFNGNNLRIVDTTQEEEQYIPENICDQLFLEGHYANNKFKYSQTYTINIIQRNTTSNSTIVDTIITDHCSYLDEAYYKLIEDGHYTIYHIILPSVSWVKEQIELGSLPKELVIYTTDGSDIYKYCKGQLYKQDSRILAEINTAFTTISRSQEDIFSIANLQQCYIRICKSIFNNLNLRCLEIDNKELIRNRDFIWMTINIIQYYIEFCQLQEAQRILEKVTRCNGLCRDTKYTNYKNPCGCG